MGAVVWVTILLLLEGAVRVRERVLYGTFSRAGTTLYVAAPQGHHELRAGLDVAGTRMQVHVNALGFRGREVALPKSPGAIRVVCVGGSTTFDIYAVNDEETWPARLERKLRVGHPRVEVVNAGVSGYTVDDVLAPSFWQKIEGLSPDVLVGYLGTNEISQAAKRHFSGNAAATPQAPGVAAQTLKAVTDWSLLAYKAWLVVDARSKPPEAEGQGELDEGEARGFESKLSELVRRAKSAGARPALGTFALRWRDDQPVAAQRAGAAGAFSIFSGLSLEGINHAFRHYNEAIARVAGGPSCSLIPVADELSGHPGDFADFVHFSPDGSDHMATTVARTLEASKLLDPPPH